MCRVRRMIDMDIESFRTYCLSKPGVTEHLPFDNRTLVFKVGGKMFALCDLESFDGVNLKCDPERAIELRERYSSVVPGYHMNKAHWNTVKVDGDVTGRLLHELIDHSYALIVSSLPKREREKL